MAEVRQQKLFTIGPVQMYPRTLAVSGTQLPYFRTSEFSELMQRADGMLKRLLGTADTSKSIWLTASGTAAMEAAVMNLFSSRDKLLIICGGVFGERFVDICRRHDIPYDVLRLKENEAFSEAHLQPYADGGFTGLLVNLHETSTGQLYDIQAISRFCKTQGMVLVVDAISTFLCDEYEMDRYGIDVSLISSQKGLCLSPGLSMVVINERTVQQRFQQSAKSLYFDFQDYIRNMERGQTPFTPAVGTMLEACDMLDYLCEKGLQVHLAEVRERCLYFRQMIQSLPADIPAFPLSNALTPVIFYEDIAGYVFQTLKNEMGMVVNPTGGLLANRGIRVAHIGNISLADHATLVEGIKQCLNMRNQRA